MNTIHWPSFNWSICCGLTLAGSDHNSCMHLHTQSLLNPSYWVPTADATSLFLIILPQSCPCLDICNNFIWSHMSFKKNIRIVVGTPIVFLLLTFSFWYCISNVLENNLGPASQYFVLMWFRMSHMAIGIKKLGFLEIYRLMYFLFW